MWGRISKPCLSPKVPLAALSTELDHMALYIKFLLTDIHGNLSKIFSTNTSTIKNKPSCLSIDTMQSNQITAFFNMFMR